MKNDNIPRAHWHCPSREEKKIQETYSCGQKFAYSHEHEYHVNFGLLMISETVLIPGWNDCTAYLFNGFKKQELDVQFCILGGIFPNPHRVKV